ncbi:MAG TPA: ABC transporter ATP-binding protein [Microbacteriaceae bacterium]|nr:ABC transporter ATP-binding protein [Microbacteriaceae bacterium]
MTLLQLAGVARSVQLPDGDNLDILTGIDLEVSVGDHVSIVGRSGSGKTTLLNILGMLDEPTAGTVSFEGRDVRGLSGRARDLARGRDIGFVFQQFNLLPGRTALEQVVMPLMYADGRMFWRRRELAAEMLERVGLGGRLESKPEKLSGGEQQRVAIARALVRKPRLILADEPTGALDIDTGASVMGLLDQVATESGAALITITHDLHVAARARRHYRLDGGVLRPADLELAFAASTLVVDAKAEAALGLTTPAGAEVAVTREVLASPEVLAAPEVSGSRDDPAAREMSGEDG